MRRVFVFVFMCVTAMLAFSEGTLRFAGVEDTTPFFFKENGVTQGIANDLFLKIAKEMGVTVSVEILPFKRLLDELQSGQLDGAIQIYYNKDRESFITYSEIPMYTAVHSIFVKKGKEFAFSELKDLYGKKVGKQSGFTVSKEFDQAANDKKFILDEATNLEMNAKKLLADRIDCFVSSYILAKYTLKKLSLQNQVVALPKPLITEKGTFLAISKKSKNIKNQAEFMNKLNALLKQFHKDGSYDAIVAKY